MKEAIRLSREKMKKGYGGPFGAVVVKNGKIIARGYNKVPSSNDPTAHAEIMAIRKACKVLGTFILKGCEIYTSCEPCPMCLGAIYWARPDAVYYCNTKKDAAKAGFDDHLIYEEIEKAPDQRKIPFIRLEEKDAAKALEEWKKFEGRIEY